MKFLNSDVGKFCTMAAWQVLIWQVVAVWRPGMNIIAEENITSGAAEGSTELIRLHHGWDSAARRVDLFAWYGISLWTRIAEALIADHGG